MARKLDITADFADIKMDHLALLDGRLDVDLSRQYYPRDAAAKWLANPDAGQDGWDGGSANQTRDWIRHGYNAGTAVAAPVSGAPRKRTRWREEGDDLDITRAWSGDPTPFSTRETGTKQGIRINVEVAFGAQVEASVVSDYGQWLAKIAAGFSASGHDLEITATTNTAGTFAGSAPQHTDWKIRLKRFGQASDYAAWSPLFSPTGFRHLTLCWWGIEAERHGHRLAEGLGKSRTPDSRWGIEFDAETNTLTITSQYRASSFDAEKMDKLLKDALAGRS